MKMETFWKLTRAVVAIFLAGFVIDVVYSLFALRNGDFSLVYATLGAAYFLVVLPLIFAFIYAYRTEKEVTDIRSKNDDQMKKLDTIKERLDALSEKIDPTVTALSEIQVKLEVERARQSQEKKETDSNQTVASP
jgi:hypothetical protein